MIATIQVLRSSEMLRYFAAKFLSLYEKPHLGILPRLKVRFITWCLGPELNSVWKIHPWELLNFSNKLVMLKNHQPAVNVLILILIIKVKVFIMNFNLLIFRLVLEF